MSLFDLLPAAALRVVDLVAETLRRLRITFDVGAASVRVEYRSTQTIDERIAKLDATGAMLRDALEAIEELRDSATTSKDEVNEALRRLSELQQNKQTLEQEIANIRAVIGADITTFRKVAGVPSSSDIRRERLLGFLSGVIASVVAAGIVWLITAVVHILLRR